MYLVSSCLAGINCRYDGNSCKNNAVAILVENGKAIPVCPEVLAGLPSPRPCCEIDGKSGKVIDVSGKDLTEIFMEGAEKALTIAKKAGITKAILKSKSPSCGYGGIYDGTFSGNLKPGNGITAKLFAENGIEVLSENDLNKIEK